MAILEEARLTSTQFPSPRGQYTGVLRGKAGARFGARQARTWVKSCALGGERGQ